MNSLTFLVNTQHNPPVKGSHAQAINAHCATIGHRRRQRKRVTSELAPPQTGHRTLVLKKANTHEHGDSLSESDQPQSRLQNPKIRQRLCPDCARIQRSPSICPHAHNFDAQLYSILDPFSTTPLKLSTQEQTMLQEFLTNDKMLVYGTAVGPQQICFTRAYSRANLPWGSKLHLLAHITMAEAPLRQKNEVSSTFYLRRAQTYEAMNEQLSNENTSFREKVISFLTLSLIETSLGMLDLQAKHVNALHSFIEDNGGMPRIFSELCPANLADDLPGIMIQHLSENVPIIDIHTLEETISRFMQVLRDTKEWASEVPITGAAIAQELQTGEEAFPRLRTYLDSLVDYLNREDLSPRVPQGIFHCMFGNLMLHQTVYEWDAPTSLRFLGGTEKCLAANTRATRCEVLFSNIFWVQGATSTALLNSVHSTISEPIKEKEICVLEGTYASLRSVALLSPSIRAKLAQSIRKCILAAITPIQEDLLEEDFLQTIAEDIRKNWTAARTVHESDGRYLSVKKLPSFAGIQDDGKGL